jgi:hypothetical protein
MNKYTSAPHAEGAKRASLSSTRHFPICAKVSALKTSLCIGMLVAACTLAPILSAAPPTNALVGRWDLTLTTPQGDIPSWIEVSEDSGHATLVMVGVTDHATPLKTFEINGIEIQFVSPKGEEGFPDTMLFKGKLVGRQLEGTVTGSTGVACHWKGVRAPKLDRKGPPEWEASVKLFNGKNLDGWHLRDTSHSGTWKVEDGLLVSTGHGTELVSNSKFEDFKLHVEFKCGPSSNSGIFLRGRYEVQIENDSVAEPNSHHTGGVYGFLAPTPEQPRTVDVWQTFDITLVGRKVTIVQDGVTIIDNREIPGITGGAFDSHEALSGPIYLQGTEEGTVTFKNIVITPGKKQ